MGLLATLKVMLGVDSVEFQTKMRESQARVGVFENEFGKRTTLVERHGMRLVSTASSISSSMGRMSKDGISALSDLAQAAGFMKFFVVLEAFKTGLNIGKFVNDVSGLKAAFATAGPPVKELAAELAKNADRFDETADAAARMAEKLGLTGPEWAISRERTLENAAALLKLLDALREEKKRQDELNPVMVRAAVLQKLAAERAAELAAFEAARVKGLRVAIETQERFNLAHGQFVSGALQVQIALAAGIAKQKEYAEAARRALGVMNAADLRASAEEIRNQVIAIAQSGGSAAQTVEALGTKIAEVVKVAKELGIQLDPQFERTAEAIAQGPGLAMDDLFASFRGLPKEVDASRAASAASLDRMGKDLEGKVKGGFQEGIAGGISQATAELEKWAAGAKIRIPVELDTSSLQKQIDDIVKGRIPTTTGSAP